MKTWTREHAQLAVAANRVSRKLLDLANCELARHNSELVRLMISLAADLRRAVKAREARRSKAA